MLRTCIKCLTPTNIFFEQVRPNTVNFFRRRRTDELWKTITSVSSAGKKRGRLKSRQPVRPLRALYRIGSSPMKVQFPGLNTSVEYDELAALDPISVIEQTDQEIKESLGEFRLKVDALRKKRMKRQMQSEKLYPLERGFSSTKVVGQRLGPPPPCEDMDFDDFESICLEIKTTCAMSGMVGKVYSREALVFIGNGKGLAGYAVARASFEKATLAIARALKIASRQLFTVELLEGRTIFQDFFAECNHTKVYAMRAPLNYGLICHPRLTKICQLIGIKDIYVKVEGGTTNYIALTQAFINGLLNQETHQQLADRKRLHVVEMNYASQYFPKIVASPRLDPIRTDKELPISERLRLDYLYGEGRVPLKRATPVPFYAHSEGHLKAEWRKHPYRNMEQRMIRILADGDVERWTRKKRQEYGEKLHAKFVQGEMPIPDGIGLPHFREKSET